MGAHMIKAVLFDMDGTLVDTERLGIKTFIQAAKDFGAELPVSVIKSFIGHNKTDVVRLTEEYLGSRELAEQIFERQSNYRTEWAPTQLEAKSGVHECLSALKEAGYRLELVTSSRTATAERNLKLFDLQGYFETKTCGEETTKGKPEPDIYLKGAEKLGLEPAECVVVEDSYNGALSGLNAGMSVIVIPDIVEIPADVADRAAAVLQSLHEVPAAVEALNN